MLGWQLLKTQTSDVLRSIQVEMRHKITFVARHTSA